MQQEHEVAQAISKQQLVGWEFDYLKAEQLHLELMARKEAIYNLVRPHLSSRVIRDKHMPVPNPWVKDGSRYQSRVEKYWGCQVEQVGGAYSPLEFVEPNLSSRQQLMQQLERHGWRPVNFTDLGNPKLDEESLEGLDLGDTGNLLMEHFKASQRASTLRGKQGGTGWLNTAYRAGEQRWRIAARGNPCGTNTHRFQHSNVVNVPKAEDHVYVGKQMRELFIASPGRVMVGADASQVELRCMASYMGDPDLIYEICDGDFHSVIWEPIKKWIDTRGHAKNVEYALLYGASDYKLGTMADRNPDNLSYPDLGAAMRRAIMRSLPSLDNLTSTVKQASKRGYLKGIDGFPVYMRKSRGRIQEHKALNTLLQHCGSMVVKRATVYLHQQAHKEGIADQFDQVGHFHDEVQCDAAPEVAERVGELFLEGLEYAGKTYGLACPMAGEYKIGKSWAETH
jgi:hypothetical protein